MKKAEYKDDQIKITFFVSQKQFYPTLESIKSMRGRTWNSQEKAWYVPFTIPNVQYLMGQGFDVCDTLKSHLKPEPKVQVARIPEMFTDIDESKLPKGLRPYQIEAIKYLEYHNGNGLIALFPRAGKSVVSLSHVKLHNYNKVLIVCPATAKIGWQREIKKWFNEPSCILQTRTPYELPEMRYHIINWDILYDWVGCLNDYDIVIADEVHRSSNIKLAKKVAGKTRNVPVQTTLAFQTLAAKTPRILALTGTPITSKVSQLWVLLNIYDAERFPDYYKFIWKFCDPKHNGYAWEFNGLSNADELLPLLPKYMYRRRREDVIVDLPEETHEFIPIEIDEVLYAKDLKEFEAWLKENPACTDEQKDARIAQFESLSYSKKRQQIIDWVKDFEDKIVLFTHHRSVSEDLHNVFKKQSVLVYGGMNGEKKQKAIDDFNENDKIRIFVGNIDACKEAISLYASDYVAYVELPLTVGALDQSRQRIYLPDKGATKLSYMYFIAEDTVDEDRVKRLIERAKLIDTVIDGKEYTLFGK